MRFKLINKICELKNAPS